MPNANGSADTLLVKEADEIICKQMPANQIFGPASSPERPLEQSEDVVILGQAQQ
jgi:hypothetical protein